MWGSRPNKSSRLIKKREMIINKVKIDKLWMSSDRLIVYNCLNDNSQFIGLSYIHDVGNSIYFVESNNCMRGNDYENHTLAIIFYCYRLLPR